MDQPQTLAEKFNLLADAAREEGNFIDALKYADEATVAYLAEGNTVKAAVAQSSRFLTLRHLWEKTGDASYKILAQHAVESSVDMARQTGQKDGLGIPLYNLAKWHETVGEYEKARDVMKESLELFETPSEDNGLQAQIAEIKTRLASEEYRLGDDSALERFDSAISDLETNTNPNDYVQHVWLSGAHMHLAEAMIDRGKKDEAKAHIARAKKIIDADPRLTLRSAQLDKLFARLS